ncbi:MAG: hypothetical protein ACM3UV_00795 [Nocardioidaceae bacterium]
MNDDRARGIDPTQDAGVSDIVGGSLIAGGGRVPWATFEQKSGSAQLIFVRAFQRGRWVTQGRALNIDPSVEAEAPSIDFAGGGRTVPWDAWYEPNSHLSSGGPTQIFASRFNAAADDWVPEGQDRAPNFKVPSLNINTDRTAENPSVAGGATVAGNNPVPWVAWEENDGGPSDSASHRQIFVSRGIARPPAPASCAGVTPSAEASVSVFCWQEVGVRRLAKLTGASDAGGDPTLNIDPTRNGVEPDIAFTGPNDTVPWVVWYEKDSSGIGLRGNEQVFAAKAVSDGSAAGAFPWQAVGNGTAGKINPLDTSSPPHSFGPCAASVAAEDDCSLNAVPSQDAEDPRVAAGTLTPGGTTVPWVTWAEQSGGSERIFVSRLVGGDHFELFNGGRPVSNPGHDASQPDITFFGNVPYISWIEKRGQALRGFVGHFEAGVFLSDTPGGIRLVSKRSPRADLIDFRVPISSSCTSDPFTKDGTACAPAPITAPFFTFTTAGSPQRLFAQAVIGGLDCVTFRGCRVVIRFDAAGALIVSRLADRERVGILVQRVVRVRRGRRFVTRFRRVGRVPLGVHRKGRVRLRWRLKVGGRRLKPGRYRVTLRAVDRRGRALGRARPVTVRIRR